jgi:methylphosphotriester-DNA--protein-cysteine methyltransferase
MYSCACKYNRRPALVGRVCQPLSTRYRLVARCKPTGKDDAEKDELVKEAVKTLRKADIDQAAAREMMKMWKEVENLHRVAI